jgi:hypothetical protein
MLSREAAGNMILCDLEKHFSMSKITYDWLYVSNVKCCMLESWISYLKN